MTALECTQCGAAIHAQEDSFLHCSACDAALFINTRRLILHQQLSPRIADTELPGHLRRWLHQLEVAGQPSQMRSTLQWWPMWEIAVAGRRRLMLAATSPWPEWEQLDLSAGQRAPFDANRTGEVIMPERSVDVAMQVAGADEATLRLLHVPIYAVSYQLNDQPWQVAVDALEGTFYAEQLPQPATAQLDQTHLMIFGITTLIFVAESLLSPSLGWTLVLYGVTGFILYHAYKHYLQEHLHG